MTVSAEWRPLIHEALTLGTPRGRLSVFIPVIVTLALIPVAWLERTLPPLSICNALLGSNCWSVGITRGISSILKGQYAQAWHYNPLAYVALIIMLGIVTFDAFGAVQTRFAREKT